jgi:uncharacterized lipoprotein NlpE involved in copper resistance
MKKILFLTIAAIALLGCNNENDEVTDKLGGTVWVNEQTWDDVPVTVTLRFTDDKNVTLEAKSNDGKVSESVKCTYTFNPPTIMIFTPFEEESEFISMTLKGNTIEHVAEDGTYIFKKK